jgi:hypothetical protein
MSCPRCGADNQCQVASATNAGTSVNAKTAICTGNQSCWCFQVPITAEQRLLLPKSDSCYCAACLDALVREIKT